MSDAPTLPAPIKLSGDTGGGGERRYIPDNTDVLVEVESITQRTFTYKDKDTGQDAEGKRFVFKFVVIDGDYKSIRVYGETFPEFEARNNCRLYRWVTELYGQNLPEGFELDFAHLIGKRAYAHIGLDTGTKGNGDEWKSNDVKWLDRAGADVQSAQYATDPEPGSQISDNRSAQAAKYDDLEPF